MVVCTIVGTLLFGSLAIASLFVPLSPVLQIISYIVYALAALFLSYAVFLIVKCAPKIKEGVVRAVKSTVLGSKLLESYTFQTLFFLFVSLFISFAYALYNGALGIVYSSIWYGSLSAYYLLLTSMRSGIALSSAKERKLKKDANEQQENTPTAFALRNHVICGVLLIVSTLALSVAIAQMVASDAAFIHEGWLIYASAAYTFYKVISSTLQALKAKKQTDYIVQSVRNINLADALVSLLALQTALFYAFAEGQAEYVRISNAATGFAVCALVIALGVYMIIQATTEKTKQNNQLG